MLGFVREKPNYLTITLVSVLHGKLFGSTRIRVG